MNGHPGRARRGRRWWGVAAAASGVGYLAWRAVATRADVPPALWWAAYAVEVAGLVGMLALLVGLRRAGAPDPDARPAGDGEIDVPVEVLVDVVVRVDRQGLGKVMATLAGLRPGIDAATVTLLRFTDRPELDAIAERFGVGLRTVDHRRDDAGLRAALEAGDGPFVAVLDAGDVPLPGFARHAVAWVGGAEGVGAVRTPVDSWAADSAEHDARGRHELWFERQVLHPAAGGWAQLAGSGTVLRRSAVAEVGVPRGRRRSVELRLSGRLHRAGWRVVAPVGPVLVSSHPIDTARAVARDRRRETAATIRLLTSLDGPLSPRRRPRGARSAALAASVRPLAGLRRAGFIAVLVASFAAARLPFSGSWATFVALWSAFVMTQALAVRAASLGRLQFGDRARWSFSTMGPAVAALAGGGRRRPGAPPRGGRRGGFGRIVASRSVAAVVAVLASGLLVVAASDRFADRWADRLGERLGVRGAVRVPPMDTAGRTVLVAAVLWCLVVALDVLRCLGRGTQRRAATRIPADLPATLDGVEAVVVDITPSGAGALARGEFRVGEVVPLVLEVPALDGSRPVRAAALVRSARPGDDVTLVGLELVSMSPESSHALYELCEVVHPSVVLAGGWGIDESAPPPVAARLAVRSPRRPLVRFVAVAGLVGVCSVTAPPFSGAGASGVDGLDGSSPVAPPVTGWAGPAVTVTVFADADRDGRRSADEPGVEGVAVRLYRDVDGNRVPEGDAVASGVTGVGGVASLVGAADESVVVEIDAPGGLTSSTGLSIDAAGTLVRSMPVDVGDAAGASVEMGLARPLLVQGRVWDDSDADGVIDGDPDGSVDGNVDGSTVGPSGEYADEPESGDAGAAASDAPADESGIAGVMVRLFAVDPVAEDPVDTATVVPVAVTTTDAAGRYRFTGVGPGSYVVDVVPPSGLVPSRDRSVTSEPFVADAQGPAVDIGLWRPVAVGDTVWNDLDDDGVQDDGEPGVQGVTVRLFGADGRTEVATGPDGVVGTPDDGRSGVVTGADGRYRFSGLVPGTYRVGVVVPAGWRTSSRPDAGDANDDTDRDDNASPTPLGPAGGVVLAGHVDLGVGTEPTTDGDTTGGSTGDTDDSSNLSVDVGLVRPAAAVSLQALANGATALSVPTGATVVVQLVVTNTGNVPVSEVRVADDRLAPAAPDCNGADPGDGQPFDLAVGDVRVCTGSTLAVAGPNPHTVTVTAIGETAAGSTGALEPVAGRVDITGGVPGVAVTTSVAVEAPGSPAGSPSGVRDDGDLGPSVAPGLLHAVPAGSTVWWLHAVTNTTAATVEVDAVTDRTGTACSSLVVPPGATVWCSSSEVVQRPADGGPITNRATVVATDAVSGGPVPWVSDAAQVLVPSPAVSIAVSAGPAGVAGLDAGSTAAWRYVVTNTGDWPLATVTVVDDVQGTIGCPLLPGPGSTLPPGASVTCTSLATVPGAPAPAGPGMFAGLATVVGPVPAGPVVLPPIVTPVNVVATPAVPSAGVLAAVSADAVSTVQPLVASIGDRVWLDSDADGVQDEGEGGLANVVVRLVTGDGTVRATTITDSAGAFRFAAIDPGTYAVEVVTPDGHDLSPRGAAADPTLDSDVDPVGRRTQVITVAGGADVVDLDVGVFQLAAIGDRVWWDADDDGTADPGDGPMVGVTVRLFGGSGEAVRSARTDGRGRFRFEDLAPGEYAIEVEPPTGYEPATATSVDVRSGQSGVFTLTSGQRLAVPVALVRAAGSAVLAGAGSGAKVPVPPAGANGTATTGGSVSGSGVTSSSDGRPRLPAGLPSTPAEGLRLVVFAMAALVIVALLMAMRPVTSSLVPVAGFGVARLRPERNQSTT